MSVRNAANPAIWLVSGMCGMFDIRTATAGGIRRCVMSSRSHRSLRYNVSLNCHVTLPFFYVKNKFWLVLRRRLSQRKVVLLPRRNRKLRWEKKKKTSALYRLRKPSKCWIHNRQYAYCIFICIFVSIFKKKHNERKHSEDNRLRFKRFEKVLFWGGWKNKNWITIPSLFLVVQLEFVYHADNWTVHSKLYVPFFYFALRNWQMPDFFIKKNCFKFCL